MEMRPDLLLGGSLILILVSLIVIVLFFDAVMYHGDLFYFLRKKQFYKKLRKRDVNDVQELLNSLLDTSFKEWKKYDDTMVFQVFNNTKVVYENSNLWDESELFIIEGKGSMEVIKLKLFDDGEIGQFRFSGKINQLATKQVFSHLEVIFKTHEKLEEAEIQSILNQEKLEKEAVEKRKKQEHNEAAHQLKEIVNKISPPFSRYEEDDFVFTLREDHYLLYLEISYKDVSYFEATCVKKSGQMDSEFLNQGKEESHVISNAQKELMTFVYRVFSNVKTEEEITRQSDEQIIQQVEKINEAFAQLNQEKDWLSIESDHLIHHTFPKDLKELLHVYYSLQNKESVEPEIKQSLHMMQEKLECIREEAENNKKMKIKQKSKVIEKR